MKHSVLAFLIISILALQLNAQSNEIMDAVEKNDIELAKKLIIIDKSGIEFKKSNNTTPIIQASFNNNTEMIILLAEHGANIAFKQKGGWNAFSLAVYNSNIEVLKYFLNRSDKLDYINIIGHNGWTPLSLACAKGEIQLVELLIQNGATIKSSIGWSDAISMASNSGSISCVTKLSPYYSADELNRLDETGYGVIHYFVMGSFFESPSDCNKEEVLSLLLENGININLNSKTNEYWYSFTDERKDSSLENIIVKYGGKRY